MYFEDVAIGDHIDLGSFTFTGEAIRRFAIEHDPQPFHLDDAAGRATHFGGLVASGWHVAAVWMKLMVAYHHAQAERTGIPVQLGPSPGFTNMIWARPTRPGDTLHYSSTVTTLTSSKSRPLWGIVTQHNEASNQDGLPVFAFEATVFWKRRLQA